MPTAGLLYVNLKTTDPEKTSPETFAKWYETVLIPDVLRASPTGITTATRYKSIDPKADRPYLALYPVEDMTLLDSAEFKTISVTSNLFPEPSNQCFDFADFDLRYYEHLDTYEPEGSKPGLSPFIMPVGLTPATGTDADFAAWYHDEHYSKMSAVTHYRRTRRYRLQLARQNRNVVDDQSECLKPPAYLTIHEFDAEPPMEEIIAGAQTEWARRTLSAVEKAEMGKFEILNAFGDVGKRY